MGREGVLWKANSSMKTQWIKHKRVMAVFMKCSDVETVCEPVCGHMSGCVFQCVVGPAVSSVCQAVSSG